MQEPDDITIEIGSPRTEELDAMLEVMCGAFDMPFGLARDIFYQDPYFSLENKRVLRIDGRIVSCLTVVEHPCRLGAGRLTVAGIAGVATLAAERGRGYATRLLADTLEYLAARGFGLSALFPVTLGIYQRLGWSLCSPLQRMYIAPQLLRPSPLSCAVRKIQLEDVPAVSRIYDRFYGQFNRIRDLGRWNYLLKYVPHSVVFQRGGGAIEGYDLWDMQIDRDRTDRAANDRVEYKLRLLEHHALTEEAHRGLEGFLAMQRSVSTVEIHGTPSIADSYRAAGNGAANSSLRRAEGDDLQSTLMVRAVLWDRLCSQLSENWRGFGGVVLLRIHDAIGDRKFHSVLITGANSAAALPNCIVAVQDASPHTVTGALETWSQVAVGCLSGADALRRGVLVAASAGAAAAVSELFPLRGPFIPIVDHF